jgi:A/G-specific adenine glycosylase
VTPHQRKITAINSNLLEWYQQNARDLPWRRTHDPYAVWVSEIMLQQTQVKTVLAYWKRWMLALPDIRALARAKPGRLHKLWEGLGYYTRVRNMQKAARLILATHQGEFPRQFDDVLALPGIGRYTAGAICSIAFNQPKPILDGNVIRVVSRLFGIAGDPHQKPTNADLWRVAEQLVQQASMTVHVSGNTKSGCPRCSQLNQSLMELGALVCTPKQPRCEACPVARQCVARREDRVEELPGRRPRARSTALKFVAFVTEKDARFFVRQRPANSVNAHLWEFPNVELASGEADLKAAARKALGYTPQGFQAVCKFKHSITRYRITLDVLRVIGNGSGPTRRDGRWLGLKQLRRLAFTGAHKKILEQIGAEFRLGAALILSSRRAGALRSAGSEKTRK